MGRRTSRLRVLRAEQGVTQIQIARKAGLSQTRYWQIENGEGPDLRADERDAIAAALGVKTADIAWPEMAKAQAS